ncbi:MAG: phosphonate ABC transporter, permease protein PhnE [Cyanobacteria bacterium P01_E01_bin.34]
MTDFETSLTALPPRWKRPGAFWLVIAIAFLAFFIHGAVASDLTPQRLFRGIFRLGDFLRQAFPPSPNRFGSIVRSTIETFEIALVGTVGGALLSLPLALLAAKNTTPHSVLHSVSRSFIALLRVIPDLIWGLIFIVVVGLGAAPGILAIAVDTIGFCGKFFAERIEEVDPGPVEALRALGAPESGIVAGAIFPAVLPSFVATSLFALESSVRSAVVLGLVGAGGIGVELQTSMQLLRYDEALTIILVIFVVVTAVERLSAAIRKAVI